MNNIKKTIVFFRFLTLFGIISITAQDKYFTKSGYVNFYSHTLVEDIQANNNQVLSVIDIENGDILIKMLMRSFRFKKALMQEHFNENYIESHKFPRATFKGNILNIEDLKDTNILETIVAGKLTIHGVEKDVEIKTKIIKNQEQLILNGVFYVKVSDFDIKIPAVVSKNISETIKISFELKHKPYK